MVSDKVSFSTRWMWIETQPTARPIAVPPAATLTNPRAASPAEKAPVINATSANL